MTPEQINSMITEYLSEYKGDSEMTGWIGVNHNTNYPEFGFDDVRPTIELASQDEVPPLFSGYDYLVQFTKTEYWGLEVGKILTLKTPQTETDEAKEKEMAIYN